MGLIQRETDLSVCDGNIEEIAGAVAALTVHAHSALGVRCVQPTDLVPPSELSERLGLLVWALSLLRCPCCSGFASESGRLCQACAAMVKS